MDDARQKRLARARSPTDQYIDVLGDGHGEKYQAKYEDACACLQKDRDVLLAFYDFPAEHWKRLRTTNPIESTFATIRLRHRRTKGSGTRKTSLAMMFKLAKAAQKRWRRLNGHEHLVLWQLETHVLLDEQTGRLVIELLADFFAKLPTYFAAARAHTLGFS